MVQKDFNTIIGQIEEDLKKLQSAKEQVEKVVAENTAFSEKASELIVNTDKLLTVLKEDTNGIVNSFSTSLAELKQQLEKLIKDSQSGISDIHNSVKEEHGKILQSTKTKIEEALNLSAATLKSQKDESQKTTAFVENKLNEIQKKLENLYKEYQDKIAENTNQFQQTTDSLKVTIENKNNECVDLQKNVVEQHKIEVYRISEELRLKLLDNIANFEQTSENLKTSISEKIEELKNLAKNTLEEQKSENLKTLNLIIETHNNIKQLIGQLFDLKISETMKIINENLSGLRKEFVDTEINNQNRFKTNKILHISTLAMIGVFGIVIILKLFGII